MTSTSRPTTAATTRRWAMLAASTFAQATAAVVIHGPAFLIPALHDRLGMGLATAGLVAAAPTAGVMLTLVAWGMVVDRWGERFALLSGMTATTLAVAVATSTGSTVVLAGLLFVAGAAAAATNSASGRVVVGWFPPERRGLAMGIRQMAQPLGVGIGAILIPVLADRYGVAAALWAPAVGVGVATVAVWLVVLDPPRPERAAAPARSPYREDRHLTRIHLVSVLLVVPQFLVWTFALVWLVQDRGWDPAPAGAFVAATQLVGAGGRIVVGHLSDHVRSRMRPLRWVSVAAAASMVVLGITAGLGWWVAVPLMTVATAVTVADNGLAFTGVAERAGPFWSGRALGVQNTAQFLTASVVPPVAGLAIAHWGHPATFALSAVFPLVAVALVPTRSEPSLR